MEAIAQSRTARWLESPDAVRWVRLAELTAGREVSCIDGRHQDCTVGAPGGNAGELTLALTVLEWFGRTVFEQQKVRCVLERVIEHQGRFYLHTDAHALRALREELVAAEIVSDKEVPTVQAVFDLLSSPPPELRPRLLEYVVRPEYVGCGHLRSLLTSPESYRVRRELIEHVIVAFFELHWDGALETDFVVLDGDHHEAELVNLNTTSQLSDDTLVPTVCPAANDGQVFVNHVPALRYLRRKTVALLLRKELAPRLAEVLPLDVLLEIERLGERHLATTLERLAPGLPRRRVVFDGERAQLLEK